MTTLTQCRGYADVRRTLGDVESFYRRIRLLSGAAITLTVTLGLLVVVGLFAGLMQLPSWVRWVLLGVLLGGPVLTGAWFVVRPALRRRSEQQVARAVEEQVTGLRNGLINTVQLARETIGDPTFLRLAVAESARSSQRVDPRRAVPTMWLRRSVLAAGGATVLLLVFLLLGSSVLAQGLHNVFAPNQFIPHRGSVQIVEVQPGDATALAGDPVTILVTIENPQRKDYPARTFVENGSAARREYPMSRFEAPGWQGGGKTTYRVVLDAVDKSLRYRVEVADSQTRWYQLTVRSRFQVEGMDHVYHYPGYTGKPPQTREDVAGPIEVPMGTKVYVNVRLKTPVSGGQLVTSRKRTAMQVQRGGRLLTASLDAFKDDKYAVIFVESDGRVLGRLPDPSKRSDNGTAPAAGQATVEADYYPIRVTPDQPPRAWFAYPGRDIAAAPGSTVKLAIKGEDDYGLSLMQLRVQRPGEDQPAIAREVREFKDRRAATVEYELTIDPQATPGQVISYWASATDNRQMPGYDVQTSVSEVSKIHVQDAAKVERDRLMRLEELLARLRAILTLQVQTRAKAVYVKHLSDPEKLTQQGGEVLVDQRAVRAGLLDVGENFSFDAQTAEIQKMLLMLAHNEAAEAVGAADALSEAGPDSAPAKADTLIDVQNKIIEVLRTLIGVLPSLKDKEVTDPFSRPGGDIPPDQREKLAKLREELEKFIEQQKKVIEASKDLAKRPVDDYTEADLAKLEELIAAQDKWEQFLKGQISDFSKIAEQDFSNPSLLQEMIEIRDDVKMAKDALQKKATEIAVPIEDAGLELAEELTTHLEKWLPDEPDRTKWSMEEPTGQTDVPMAELPKELEDIIGDLLEEEEDIFDEMQDVTSKWTDSLDKGAGWDTLDGPISNMSAQGVTGNQLPNPSEISGRSGQGRSGKSSGEMVEETAQDLGGRRTPTRLSPDPFQKGQVDDRSEKDTPGGATGGGKLSGAGGEGLEGPVPPPLQQELARLANKQAALRNKAEKINLDYNLANYSNFADRFGRIIRLMERTEDDLNRYRYHNALRRRSVLVGDLAAMRTIVGGKIHVQQDTTPHMASQVRSDIADVSEKDYPAGFNDLLKRYYELLATESTPPATTQPGS